MNQNFGGFGIQDCTMLPNGMVQLPNGQVIHPSNMHEQDIVKTLNDMLKMTPLTPLSVSAVASALGLLEQLKRQVTQVKDDPYWKLREFGERSVQVIPPDEEANRQCRVLFYDRPRSVVYLGFPADLEQELPPVVYKATMDGEFASPYRMPLEEVITVVKDACEVMQVNIFGRALDEEKTLDHSLELPAKDWEIVISLKDNYYEVDFRKAFEAQLESFKPLIHGSPSHQYWEFSQKSNLGHIFGNPRRGSEDIRVWSIGGVQHYEWTSRL